MRMTSDNDIHICNSCCKLYISIRLILKTQMSQTHYKLASFLILQQGCIFLCHFNRILILQHVSYMSIHDIMHISEQTNDTNPDSCLFQDHIRLYLAFKRSTGEIVIGAHYRDFKIGESS